MSIYTNPPAWIRKKGYDTVLTKNGWVAIYPNGKQELVVALRNVPEKYLINKPTFREPIEKPIKEPIKQPEPAPIVSNANETKEKASVSVSIAESSIAKSSIAETEKKTYRKPKTTKAV